MKSKMGLLPLAMLMMLVTSCSAQFSTPVPEEIQVPNPPDLRNTPLKVGDFWTYRIEFTFAGLNITEIAMTLTNQTLTPEEILTLKMYERTVLNITSVLSKIEPKITILSRTADSITMNVYFYYNETIKGNETRTFTLLPQWEVNETFTCFPFIRPPNDSHENILTYINPHIEKFKELLNQTFPGLDISKYYYIGTTETTGFYGGAYRKVNELRFTIPHVISSAKEILAYLNKTEIFEKIPENMKKMELDLDMYVHWDKETGVLAGYKFSARLTSISWFAYRVMTITLSSTNLWAPNIMETFTYSVKSLVTGCFENIITYYINGFILGDTSAQSMFVVCIIGTIAALGVITYIIRRLFGRKEKRV